jgi:prepilin-type N-terminal cleavage/methylation domain-containing protein
MAPRPLHQRRDRKAAARRRLRPRGVVGKAGARGVTLIEIMAVITIIGLFVALSAPGMSGILQDRHAARAADEVANVFRIARSRAAATGTAHFIQINASGNNATIELRTALTNVGGPMASCRTPAWTDADSRVLRRVELAGGTFNGKNISLTPAEATGALTPTPVVSEYCYTPGGMPWWRTGGVWTRPSGAGVAQFTVTRKQGEKLAGLVRTVRVSASGLPSIEAQ